jgi:peptidoglycan LD-endopeptidase CwlK
MPYSFGASSEAQMKGVNPKLVAVNRLALKKAWDLGFSDFCCYDGIRTYAEQVEFVKQGVSKTMHSKHLEGLAVDNVPVVSGKPRWLWPQIYQIASCMFLAAKELDTPIRWGCVWDRRLNDLCVGVNDPLELPKALQKEGLVYNERHPGKDFPDGPHYELII